MIKHQRPGILLLALALCLCLALPGFASAESTAAEQTAEFEEAVLLR